RDADDLGCCRSAYSTFQHYHFDYWFYWLHIYCSYYRSKWIINHCSRSRRAYPSAQHYHFDNWNGRVHIYCAFNRPERLSDDCCGCWHSRTKHNHVYQWI
ncbi:hypothetical protein HBI33_251350, partial [Parastagonospora nodorum]